MGLFKKKKKDEEYEIPTPPKEKISFRDRITGNYKLRKIEQVPVVSIEELKNGINSPEEEKTISAEEILQEIIILISNYKGGKNKI